MACSVDLAEQLPRRVATSRARRLAVVVATATVGLALAGPALASDDVLAVPTPAELANPAELTATLQEELGSASGGTDGSLELPSAEDVVAMALETVESSVISPADRPDTTVAGAADTTTANEAQAGGAEVPGAADATSSPAIADGMQTEVLGEGAPDADAAPSAVAGAAEPGGDSLLEEAVTGATPAAAGVDTTSETDAGNSIRYHDANSQYHDPDASRIDPWIWEWILDVDCGGSILSTSHESGTSESPDWVWEWIWEWCGNGVPDDVRVAIGESAPEDTLGTSVGAEDEADEAAWQWRFAFDFCSDARSLSLLGGGELPQTWIWDWSWHWSCPTAAAGGDSPATPGQTTVPGSASHGGGTQAWVPAALAAVVSTALPAAPTPQSGRSVLALVLPLSLPSLFDLLWDSPVTPVAVSVVVHPSLELVVDLAPAAPGGEWMPLPWPPIVIVLPPALLAPSPPAREDRRAADAAPRAAGVERAPPPLAAPVSETLAPTGDRAGIERRGSPHSASSPPPRARALPPVPIPLAPDGHSYTAGGLLPTASALGVAALVGLLILAVPGLGRRLRVARALRPRNADRPPIDHPG